MKKETYKIDLKQFAETPSKYINYINMLKEYCFDHFVTLEHHESGKKLEATLTIHGEDADVDMLDDLIRKYFNI